MTTDHEDVLREVQRVSHRIRQLEFTLETREMSRSEVAAISAELETLRPRLAAAQDQLPKPSENTASVWDDEDEEDGEPGSRRPPNAPSTSGRPSGGGRGNNPPRTK